jgi:hypothetical protein
MSYMWSVVDQYVVMQHVPVFILYLCVISCFCLILQLFLCLKSKPLLHIKGVGMELHSVWVIGQLLLQKDCLQKDPQTVWIWSIRQTGSSRNTSYFYSGGSWSRSQLRNRPFWLRCISWFSSDPVDRYQNITLVRLWSLWHPCQFIIDLSPYNWTLYNMTYLQSH